MHATRCSMRSKAWLVQPLQIIEEQHERVFRPREYPYKGARKLFPRKRCFASCSGKSASDGYFKMQLQLGNEVAMS